MTQNFDVSSSLCIEVHGKPVTRLDFVGVQRISVAT
jgi:hypothetical protein